MKSQVRVAGSGAMGIAPGFGGDWDVLALRAVFRAIPVPTRVGDCFED